VHDNIVQMRLPDYYNEKEVEIIIFLTNDQEMEKEIKKFNPSDLFTKNLHSGLSSYRREDLYD